VTSKVLIHNRTNAAYLFRSWGRTGTTIGGTKLDQMPVKEAKQQFRIQFHDKASSLFAVDPNFTRHRRTMSGTTVHTLSSRPEAFSPLSLTTPPAMLVSPLLSRAASRSSLRLSKTWFSSCASSQSTLTTSDPTDLQS
jgi:hypothetical protein